jgi:uncharacterized protein (DUF1778 family)
MPATPRKPKDKITSLRAHRLLLRRVDQAAKNLKLTRNGFIVIAMSEKADHVLNVMALAKAS